MTAAKVGDRVTPENVASLPIGTIVEWHDPRRNTAEKTDDDTWQMADRSEFVDSAMCDPDAAPTTIVFLGHVYTPAQLNRRALAIYDAGGSRDEMAAALRGGP